MATIQQRQSERSTPPATPDSTHAPAKSAGQPVASPTPTGATPAPHGRRGGAPAMLARASAQAGAGAGALFARLDATDAAHTAEAAGDGAQPGATLTRRRAEAERLLTRWAARIHAGEWNDGIGELILVAQALERAYPPEHPPDR